MAVVIDGDGWPIYTEMPPGDTADVTVLVPVIDRLRDFNRLQQVSIEKNGKRITTRTAVIGGDGRVFQAAGIALPPNFRDRTA